MRSCIAVLYIALFCAPPPVHAQADPDALYRARADLAQARGAAAAWEARLAANPKDVESAWKLARAMYWLGGHGDTRLPAAAAAKAGRMALERGTAAGQIAARL